MIYASGEEIQSGDRVLYLRRVEESALEAAPKTVTLAPFSVNIYEVAVK